MSKKQIKFVQKLSVPFQRKRDGEMLTHFLNISLTTDEAVAISKLFELNRQDSCKPTYSLIRAFLLSESLGHVSEQVLIDSMANLKLKAILADGQAKSQYDKVISSISNPPIKEKTVNKPERRVFVPEPRRR